jgi:hypothetical protein
MPTITTTRDRCMKFAANERSEDTTITPSRRELSLRTARDDVTDPIHVGILQVLEMRVGCWQPPVYVSTAS